MVVEGGGYRGCIRVSGGYAGWVQVSGMANANVDERVRRAGVGGLGGWAGPALGCLFPLFISFVWRCDGSR